MRCKLTASITKQNCEYTLAGIKAIYLYNHNTDVTYEEGNPENTINKIVLADAADKAYRVEFIPTTASFVDELAQNGNGGKYRTHTLNFSIADYDYKLLNQGYALSLGRFTAVVVDNSGRSIILGRHNGLNATAFNYESGAADADSTGWTVTMASSEKEIARLLTSESVITSLVDDSTKGIITG